jgi:hypothetical protein
MAVRSCAENRVDGRLSEYMAMCVCTVPDQVGGPQCSTDVVAEIPIESAPSGSSAETRVTKTVSLRMVLARQATRSSLDATLSRHMAWRAEPAC